MYQCRWLSVEKVLACTPIPRSPALERAAQHPESKSLSAAAWIGVAIAVGALVGCFYYGQTMLRLARWTATKDYYEGCMVSRGVGPTSVACNATLAILLQAYPTVKRIDLNASRTAHPGHANGQGPSSLCAVAFEGSRPAIHMIAQIVAAASLVIMILRSRLEPRERADRPRLEPREREVESGVRSEFVFVRQRGNTSPMLEVSRVRFLLNVSKDNNQLSLRIEAQD